MWLGCQRVFEVALANLQPFATNATDSECVRWMQVRDRHYMELCVSGCVSVSMCVCVYVTTIDGCTLCAASLVCQEVMSLLAFATPKQSPGAYWLTRECRNDTAAVVNDLVLRTYPGE